MIQIFQSLVIFHLTAQSLRLVVREQNLDVLLQLCGEGVNLAVFPLTSHALWGCEDKSDIGSLSFEEEIYVLGEKVHFGLLLVEKECAGFSNFIVSVAHLGNDEIEENDSHGKNVDKPEDPHNYSGHRTQNRVLGIFLTP